MFKSMLEDNLKVLVGYKMRGNEFSLYLIALAIAYLAESILKASLNIARQSTIYSPLNGD